MLAGNLGDLFDAQGLPDFSLSLDGTSLKFQLDYLAETSESFPFGLNLGNLLSLASGDTSLFNKLSNLVDATGTAMIEVGAEARATISLGLDLSDPAHPRTFVYDESQLSLGIRAVASDLDFQFSFGPFNAYVKDGSAALDGDGDASTVDYASFAVTIGDGDGDARHYFDDAGNPLTDDLSADVTAAAGLSLPVYFPSDSMPLGGAGNNFVQVQIADLKDVIDGVPDSVIITAPNFNQLFTGVNIIQVLADPAAVLDGLKSQFNMVTGSLGSVISAAHLPLVGDQLVTAVNFVQDIGNYVLSAVRTKMNEALDGQTPTELLQAALYNAFGSYIQDTNGDGQITQDDVVMEIDTVAYQNIEYRVELGGTLFDLPINFGGLDILPLSLDGQIDVGMDWSWNFGFGLNVTDGFYVVTSYEPELSLNLGVSISQDLHGEMFFLDADVTSMDDAGLNPSGIAIC